MSPYRYIGHITEETWPEARAILDAFRVDYRTTPDRYAGHMEGVNVWVEVENLNGPPPWWEELVEARRRENCAPSSQLDSESE